MICPSHVIQAFVGESKGSESPVKAGRLRPDISYGEFDSGSERTLAAWIRHASRTGTLRVAIQMGGQWRKGE